MSGSFRISEHLIPEITGVLDCIKDPVVIEKILTHQDAKASESEVSRRPPCRAPPQRGLFDETG